MDSVSPILSNKYKIESVISKGIYGTVCVGKNIRTNQLVSIKLGPAAEGSIKYEAKIYKYLSGIDGFPTFRWFGAYNEYHYLVTDLLGYDIKHWCSQISIPPMHYVLQLGLQMFTILKTLHENALIHRDIKPSNFVFEKKSNDDNLVSKLYLIDFGFCKKYEDECGQHVPIENNQELIGTPNFVSINMHNGIKPSRRDDMESCIYILLYILYPQRLWFNILDKSSILMFKKMLLETDKIYIDDCFVKMLNYVCQLEYDECPDYEKLINMCGVYK